MAVKESTRKELQSVRKRTGEVVPFDKKKIADAISKAAQAVGGEDSLLADELAEAVTLYLSRGFAGEIPEIELIQDIVERVLIETGHAKTAKAYILYRQERSRIRALKSKEKPVPAWDREAILRVLQERASVPAELAEEIVAGVERKWVGRKGATLQKE